LNDDAPHLGAAMADVARAANRRRPLSWRLVAPLPSALLSPQQRWWRGIRLAVLALLVAAPVAFLHPARELFRSASPSSVKDAFGARFGSLAILLVVLFAVWTKLFAIAQRAARFVDKPGSEAALGSMKDVADQLGRLVRQVTRGRRRLVIMVDDLERCRPPRALQVCEAASQLLGHPDVVTILLTDMSVIAASAEIQYHELEEKRSGEQVARGDYGRRYLQKLVQLQFDLPEARLDELRDMLREGASRRPGRAEPGLVRLAVPQLVSPVERTSRLIRQRAAEAARRSGTILGVATAILAALDAVSLAPPAIYTAWGLVLLVTVPILVTRWVRSRRRHRTEHRIDEQIRHSAAQGTTSAEDLRASVLSSEESKSFTEKLVEERVDRYVTEDAWLGEQVESELLRFLPPVPRSIKRVFNRLRALLVVADGRSMFGGAPRLRRAHLWKWTVLQERWPELARDLARRPTVMELLEGAQTLPQLEIALAELRLDALPSQDLVDFLAAEPRLGPILQRLVRFEPVP
jgi:ABC-type multidrug transport system fused ATPase/permease subunit